jgi:comEA protein
MKSRHLISLGLVGLVLASTPLHAQQNYRDAYRAQYQQQYGAPININTATVEEIAGLPGIGQARAIAIINYRTENGFFDSFEELDNVQGIGPATISMLTGKVLFEVPLEQQDLDTSGTAQRQAPAPSLQTVQYASSAQQLSVQDMLAVKAKIQEADKYATANSPGLAFLTLLEAQQMAQGSFADELEPRIQAAVKTSRGWLDTYVVNVVVVDRTNSGRAGYIQADLISKQYTPGVQMAASGGAYTLTLEINSIEIEDRISSMQHIIRVPSGSTRMPNGEYEALKTRINIDCSDYFARRDAASGSYLQAAAGGAQLFRAVGNNDWLGGIMGFAKLAEAGNRQGESDVAQSRCDDEMTRLESMSPFTSETVTQPYTYTEKTTTKTAYGGLVIYFTGAGVSIQSSPLDASFYKRDFSRPEVQSNGISGDPEEPISEREVRMGLYSAIGNLVYIHFKQGQGLWDVMALQEAQKKTGDALLEACAQILFDGHTPQVKQQAAACIAELSPVTVEQLSRYQ